MSSMRTRRAEGGGEGRDRRRAGDFRCDGSRQARRGSVCGAGVRADRARDVRPRRAQRDARLLADPEGPRVHAPTRVAEHARGSEAAANEIRGAGSASVVGYCWGGTVAHVAASDLTSMRPSRTTAAASRRCSTRNRAARSCITSAIRTLRFRCRTSKRSRSANPESPVFVYPGAGHGFNCDERGSYSAKDAKIAFERSLEFLQEQTT